MRQLLGFLLLVAIGCATQPSAPDLPQAPVAPELNAPLPPKACLSARVGVEFLPTRAAAGDGALAPGSEPPAPATHGAPSAAPQDAARVVVEPAHPVSPPTAWWSSEPPEQPSELPWLSKEALMRIEDPAERFTLHFLNQLIGQDRRRVTREFGAPTLFNHWRYYTPSQGLDTHLDLMEREDQALLLSRESRHLVRFPLRRALRKSGLFDGFTDVLDDVKASIPFTREYEQRSATNFGSLSVKLRPADTDDPFEVYYRNTGWRVGSGLQRLQIGYDTQLGDNLLISVRTRYDYDPGRFGVSANLRYRVSDDTHINLLMSDRIDIITGSAMNPVIRSPVTLEAVDNSKGVLFYVEHLF